MKKEKSLTNLRGEVIQLVRNNENIPTEFHDLSVQVVIDVFNIIRSHLGGIELAFRRTRMHPDIKTSAEIRKQTDDERKKNC